MSLVNVTWCDVNNGIEFISHKLIRHVLDWLYSALEYAEEFQVEEMYIRMPSGVAFKIVSNWEVYDFRLDPVRYWGVRFYIMGVKMPVLPLPKIQLDEEVLRNLIAPLNIPIPNSEDLYYYDEDTDTYKLGTEFTPERQYHLLSDGAKDVAFWALIMALCYALTQVNLYKVAADFVKRAFTSYQKFRTWQRIRSISDLEETIENFVSEHTAEDLSDDLETIKTNLSNLMATVGLRLRL